MGLPVLRALSLCTCCRHYPGVETANWVPKLGLWAVRPKRNASKRHPEHKVYPVPSARQNDRPAEPEPALAKAGVWAADITYLAMQQGFCTW